MKLPILSRLLVAAAALLLGVLYVVPLWRIDLGAPQYPEGLGLRIWIDNIAGMKPNDLANINGLNHYIGMRPIEPDAIPELTWMPWILGALIAFALLVALIGRRRLLQAWLITVVVVGAAGLYDFWKWGYDYGHNLDEEMAIIKVPGMTYSPPIIGTKKLLNFTATSMPATGGYLAGAAFLLGAAALMIDGRARRRDEKGALVTRRNVPPAIAAGVVLTLGCASGAVPISYGEDACGYCRMVITDDRFGASVVTSTGRTQQFDSIECLVSFLRGQTDAPQAVLVADFTRPGTMIPADEALFVRTARVHGPMGPGLAAVASEQAASSLRDGDAPLRTLAELLVMPAAAGHVHSHDVEHSR